MLCTFCGTDNRPENKFCGMCGVRLERRKADRRLNQRDVSLKCVSCGHVNEPGYKFCGICGTRIERRMGERRGGEAVPQRASAAMPAAVNAVARRQEAAVATMPSSRQEIPLYVPSSPAPALRTESVRETEREPVRETVREPVRGTGISGPSFLGLGSDPGPEGEGDGDYLLEEESSSHGGLRAFILLLIVAAIAGLIYMQWRSSNANSGAPQQPNPQPAGVPQPAGKNAAPVNGPAPQNAQAALPGNASQSEQKNAAQDPKALAAANADSALGPGTALAATKDPADTAPNKALKEDVKASSAAEADDASDPADPPDTPKPSATKASTSAAKAAKAPESPPRKPSAALLRAQQYLQGRGVPQSCEQGLVYLRAAAQKNEPDAAVQMAALYASGHCVAQDRVMAYRWFNSAHELEPANPWIQKDMSRMLSQMTPQERRQVGY